MPSQYQPHYHFYPEEGFMNDPNGLIYHQGEYHLFYQYLQYKHWGHAVSRDLVHWERLPIALEPDDLGDIWSGCVVVDRDNSSGFFPDGEGLVAIFTHQNSQRTAPPGPQIQSIACSRDCGRTWTMYEHNPVIPNPGVPDFRDPHVFWHEASQAWVMVVAFKGDRVRLYRSPDLKQWELASEFGVGRGDHSGVWECPNLFALPLDGKSAQPLWVLHVSIGHGRDYRADQPDMQYFLGHFDGLAFTPIEPPETVHWSDYGKDNYAAVTWANIPPEDGRRIWIGWCNNWRYADRTPTAPWQGMMTIPRVLHLKSSTDGIKLLQRPIDELARLREHIYRHGGQVIDAGSEIVLPVQASAAEVIAVFRAGGAEEFGLQVRKGRQQWTSVGYEMATEHVFVDRSKSGEHAFDEVFAERHYAPLSLQDGLLTLHIFIDASSIEVFANGGEAVISDLIFPDADSQQILVYALAGTVELCSLEVYTLRDAR